MNKCKDCGSSISSKNHEYCSKCLAQWYLENDIPDDVPSGDFDEPRFWGNEEY